MTTEEAGRVASEVTRSLSRSPAILGVLVFNALILGMLFYMVREAADRTDKRFHAVMDACLERSR